MPTRGEERSVGAQTYEWNGRRWVPAAAEQSDRKPISTKRSRYSQGAPRPARDTKPADEQVQTERTGRDARRGSGVRGRGPEQPLSFSPAIRGRSGAQRAKNQPALSETASTPQAPENLTATPPQTPSVTGRDETLVSPYGDVQTGTLMGSRPMTMDEANVLLGRTTNGYSVSDPFTSNHLPVSASDLYGTNGYQTLKAEDIPENMYNVRPKTMGKNLDIDMGPFDLGNAPEYEVSGMKIQSEMLRGSPNIALGGAAETAAATTSATDTPKTNIPKRPRGARQAEMWDRKYGRQVNQPEREQSDLEKGYKPDLARRAAFLDGNMGSMGALRAIEAQKNIVVAGGKYNMVNPNRGQEGENDFMDIGKEERDAYMGGRKTAQQVRDTYVDKIKAANAGQDASAVTPADMP